MSTPAFFTTFQATLSNILNELNAFWSPFEFRLVLKCVIEKGVTKAFSKLVFTECVSE